MADRIELETNSHYFVVDSFDNITSQSKKDRGMLKTQSVEALLLLEIAKELQELRKRSRVI